MFECSTWNNLRTPPDARMFHVEQFGRAAQPGKCSAWNIPRLSPKREECQIGFSLKLAVILPAISTKITKVFHRMAIFRSPRHHPAPHRETLALDRFAHFLVRRAASAFHSFAGFSTAQAAIPEE